MSNKDIQQVTCCRSLVDREGVSFHMYAGACQLRMSRNSGIVTLREFASEEDSFVQPQKTQPLKIRALIDERNALGDKLTNDIKAYEELFTGAGVTAIVVLDDDAQLSWSKGLGKANDGWHIRLDLGDDDNDATRDTPLAARPLHIRRAYVYALPLLARAVEEELEKIVVELRKTK